MLTRELVIARRRNGRVRPAYISVSSAELLGVAARMIAAAEASIGEPVGALEEQLEEEVKSSPNARVSRGLSKLLTDRLTIEEVGGEAEELRKETFERAAAVFRSLDRESSIESYRKKLEESLGSLDALEPRLYADLPEERRVLQFDPLDPDVLLERYNLALVQGLLINARRVDLEIIAPDVRRVRKVLRWLKFNRLVADVSKTDRGFSLGIEGPAAIFEMSKKYGLALATFALAVPLLDEFRLDADIDDLRGRAHLTVTEADGLASPLAGAPGHIPEEVLIFASALREAGLEVDEEPEPRHVGAAGMSVPDLAVRPSSGAPFVAIELFHRWHRGLLARRLDQLAERPDPTFVVGIERSLLKDPALEARVTSLPFALPFSAFPNPKKLMKTLDAMGLLKVRHL
ncbi:MAG: DUF790 family protein [Deltaproteobacteria bacterium]|nr:DUF790 family protein [Deltaproteobacteria bacterium]